MLYYREKEKEIKPNLSMKNTYPKKFALIDPQEVESLHLPPSLVQS